MVWTTKSLNRNQKYILLKHKLKDLNGFINGVKFRGGYAAVPKDSKSYYTLKKLPLISEEYPLICLKDLSFITRTSDVGLIYGKDVYTQYIKELSVILAKKEKINIEVSEREHINKGLCNFRVPNGKLCNNEALEVSPGKYCKLHFLQDPFLKELGIKVPRLSKDEKKEWREKVLKELTKLKKKGEF